MDCGPGVEHSLDRGVSKNDKVFIKPSLKSSHVTVQSKNQDSAQDMMLFGLSTDWRIYMSSLNRTNKTNWKQTGSLVAGVLMLALLVTASMAPFASGETEPAQTEDWTSFRYDHYNTGASPSEAPDTNDLYWVFEAEPNPMLPWGFYSSASVVDHVVYIGCGNGHLYAMDEASGSVLWDFVVDDYADDFPFPLLSSPAIDTENNAIYVAADGLYAIDMTDGTLMWKFDTGYWYEWWSSPSFEGDVVYLGSGSEYLYAIDAKSGDEKWRFQTGEREYNPLTGGEINNEGGGAISATPAIGPELVYIVDWADNLYAVDKANGELNFIQGFEDTFPGTNTPMEWGPIDLAAGDGMASVALDLDRNMLFIGDTAGNMWGMSMDADDNGLDDDGDGKTDNEGNVIWDYTTGDYITSSAVVYEDTVFVASWDGNLYAFDPDSGSVEWQSSIDGYPWGSQTAADGKVFMGTAGFGPDGLMGIVYAFDAGSGDEVWSMTIDNFIFAHPTPYNDKLIVGEFTGMHLAAFGIDGPKPDLYVEDLTVSEKNDDDERIVYATLGNKKNTVLSPPFDVHIYVDGKLKFNESYDSLAPGELTSANIKVDESGSFEVAVKIIQRPTGWYHIQETNLGNNEESVKIGGAMEMVTSAPATFIWGLAVGGATTWFLAGYLMTRKSKDEWEEDAEDAEDEM